MLTSGGLSRRSLADQMADAIVAYIVDEGLQEGDSLPSTADLAERFEVSRTVVREALAALAGRGVLTRSQGRESVVATPGPTELTSLLRFRLWRQGTVATDDVFECRMALEVTAARAAAQRASKDDVAQLRTHLAALAEAKADKDYHAADIALHRAIVEASGNSLIVLILDALVDLLREVRVTATRNRKARGESLDVVIEQHRAIVEAIASGSPDKAAAAMTAHLTRTREEYESRGRKR